MVFNDEQKQAIINASYLLALASKELNPVNGMLAYSISAMGESLLYQIDPKQFENQNSNQNQNSQNHSPEIKVSKEVQDLMDEFSAEF